MTVAPVSPSNPVVWARFGRLAWAVAALLALGLVVGDFPHRFEQLRAFCLNVCEAGRLPPTEAPALQRLGLTLDGYAVYTISLYLILSLACLAVPALIMWRRSGERIAVVASITLVTLGPSSGMTLNTVLPAWRAVFVALLLVGFISIVNLFYLFPDGHFVPRWSRWAFAPWILWLGFGFGRLGLRQPLPGAFWPVMTLLTLWVFGLGGLAQIYRYARVSSPSQRQQTKWVVIGFGWLIFSEVVWTIYISFMSPALGLPEPSGVFYQMASTSIDVLSLILVPFTLGIAIFRYRLWDIDVIIRRTLIYSMITLLLALAYFASVLALQAAFATLTGQGQSTLVTVLSTLVIAALFVPVRARVQSGIDRRFYRRHHDAARTLAAFGAALREHVELDALTERLIDVVDETMEPASASLWLKPSNDVRSNSSPR